MLILEATHALPAIHFDPRRGPAPRCETVPARDPDLDISPTDPIPELLSRQVARPERTQVDAPHR